MNLKKAIIKILMIFGIFILIFLIYSLIEYLNPIIESGGGFETAYVTWHDRTDASSYNVYIKNIEDNEYKQIDNELIRKYNNNNDTYWRADAIGLIKGKYQFKIVPIINDKEDEKNSIISSDIEVNENIREGFSFAKNSTNGGNSSGGYLENGTIPEDAKIIYVTKNNVNSVTLDTKNNNNEEIKLTGLTNILSNWKKENFSHHLIIRILGMIEKADIQGLDFEDESIKIADCQGLTIEGVGNDATLKGVGLLVQGSCNIEIRNLGIMLFHEDAICLEKNNSNIWIHNNDIFYGEDRGGDKEKGDGSTDIKESKYITISYNHYWDSGKTSLCGVKNDTDYITYHHNWFDYADSRSPRVRFASVHIYNNYYIGNSSYCIGATCNSSIFAEANYFKNGKYLMLISKQGTDSKKYKMSGESGGIIKSFNNIIEGKQNIVYFHEDNIQFDAYLATTRMEPVPKECKTYEEGFTYNNFDIDSDIMYSYNADEPSEVKNIVTNKAGRLNGGDIKFNTNMLDASSRSRSDYKEKELDNLLNKYKSSLILDENK